MKAIADVLADTREYIEKRGWWQGALKNPDGPEVCTVGAIVWSQRWAGRDGCVRTEHTDDLTQIMDAVIAVVEEETNVCYDGIPAWNDDPDTTEQHVLDVLARAEKIDRAGFDPDEGVVV